jgi:HEAT repeat protein
MIFLDGVPVQIGTILSGVLLLTAARVLEPVQVFVGGAVVAAVAVVVVLGIRRRYAASLLATLRRGVAEQVLEGGPGLADLITAPDVRAVLVTALTDPEPRVREMAATMLARAPGDDTLDALLAALDDPEPGVRAASAAALVGHDAVHPEHVERAGSEIATLLQGGPRERVAGLRALRRLGRRPDDEILTGLLGDGDPAVRAAAVETLDAAEPPVAAESAQPGAVADADLGRLLRALDDPTHLVRHAAADRLAARRDVPASLVDRLAAPDLGVQAAAVRAMAGHGAEVRDALVAWADAQVDRAMQLAATGPAIAALPPSPDAAFLADVVDGRRRRHQDLALEALAVLDMPEARGVVRRCLRSDDGDVRAQAIETLDSIGDRRLGRSIARLVEVDATSASHGGPGTSDDALIRLRHDDDPWIRALAARVRPNGGEMPGADTNLGDIERMLELRRVPLFERLDPEDLQRVAAVADERTFAPGTAIVREGEVGDELFVILEGRVRVDKLDPDGTTRAIRTYEAGDHFGELAVLLERPRVASVVAEDEVRTLVIGGDGLTAILRERPEAAMAMLATLAERISRQ